LEKWAAEAEQGRADDAALTVSELLITLAECIEATDDPRLARAIERSNEAGEAMRANDWARARRIYEDELMDVTSTEEVVNRDLQTAKGHLQLARVDRAEGKHAAALARATTAVEIARLADFPYFLAMVLEQYVGFAIQVGRLDEAVGAASEGLDALENTRIHALMRAALLLRRTEALLAGHDSATARNALDEAREALDEASKGFVGAGYQAQVEDWRRLDAELEQR
jgi:hypothetical protein